ARRSARSRRDAARRRLPAARRPARARPRGRDGGLDGGLQPRMSTDAIDVATIGEDVPLLEGIRTTRALRRLRPDPVPRALIRKVCEAGTFAPSGGNRQPWIFVAVTDPERRQWVAERYGPLFHQ